MSEDKQESRSEVERMWDAMAAKFGVHRKWHDLHPMEQVQAIQALNMFFNIMHD